jgi:hypothetical protein
VLQRAIGRQQARIAVDRGALCHHPASARAPWRCQRQHTTRGATLRFGGSLGLRAAVLGTATGGAEQSARQQRTLAGSSRERWETARDHEPGQSTPARRGRGNHFPCHQRLPRLFRRPSPQTGSVPRQSAGVGERERCGGCWLPNRPRPSGRERGRWPRHAAQGVCCRNRGARRDHRRPHERSLPGALIGMASQLIFNRICFE